MSAQFAAYYRVSTDRQGKSGLGIEAQQAAVRGYLGASMPIAEFTEIETGKRNDRPELERALALCRKRKAKLVIAKLDRLSRNLAFIAALMDSSVEFVAVDNPHATRLTLHILAAVAEHEREMISQRTKAALAAAKARGKRLGTYSDVLSVQNKADAVVRLTHIGPTLLTLRKGGMSTRKIAAHLNAEGIASPGGGAWHKTSVERAIGRLST